MASCPNQRERQRVKKWAPKTRSGCDTCRRRRVKCDEAKPTCKACTRLGETCFYSLAECRQYDKRVDIISRDLCVSSNTREEAFHLDIYCKTTSPWLSTYSQAEFFKQVLPIWSNHHQAIKHALVALTIAAERHYLGIHVKDHRRIWHYDQALRHMYAPKTSIDVIMLACVVLWLHDNIISDTQPAVVHVKGFIQLLLTYEMQRTPAGIGKNLDCTIWRGLSHWAQRTQPFLDTRLDKDVIATVRQRLKDPRLGRLSQHASSYTADALLYVTSVVWACDKYSAENIEASLITFQDLRLFSDAWYATLLKDVGFNNDNEAILKCHYNVMSLTLRAEERMSAGEGSDLIDDAESLAIYEDIVTALESLSADSLVQQPGKKDLVLPVIPVALEAERLAPTILRKIRIKKFLGSIKRVESFWSTSVVANVLDASSSRHGLG